VFDWKADLTGTGDDPKDVQFVRKSAATTKHERRHQFGSNSVYRSSHYASVITCLPVPVSARCTPDLNIHHM